MNTARALKIALVFLFLGPVLAYAALLPLGGLHVAITRGGHVAGLFGQWVGGFRDLKDFYLVGLFPAAVTAIAALVLSSRSGAEYIIGSIVAGGLVCVVLTNVFGSHLDLPVNGPFGYAFVGAVAAGICAFITRR